MPDRRYLGKFRGEVVDATDPDTLGRLKVKVPVVLEDLESWAMPCVPYAGKDVGFFILPPVGAKVWVEFEGGDLDFPIWTGCFWDTAEDLPGTDNKGDPDLRLLHTPGVKLTMSHVKDATTCELKVHTPVTDDPLTLTMDKEGIELNNNDKTKITLTADEIRVNDQDKSQGTWTADGITFENGGVKVSIDGSGKSVTLTDGTAKVTLSGGTVTVQTGASKGVWDASGVTLQRGAVKVALSDSGMESSAGTTKIAQQMASLALQNGAAEVALSPAAVNINKGALEIV